jgi:hypothetical protein
MKPSLSHPAMKAMLIHPETTIGRCRSCGTPVEWATTAAGKRMPFDPPVVRLPTLVDEAGSLVQVDMRQTVSHFATCPQAATWRRKRA